VPVKRLDDLRLGDVGLVKIDVEGHELAVLRGATDTLARNRAAVMVEAEERHHPNAVTAITELLTGLGYEGYLDTGDGRRPVEEFDPARHQNPANIGGHEDGWAAHGLYVNNFVFVPKGVKARE
jgi:Methyltransferase FkbM domain